ncbi:hypothetical protein [Ornithinimicrobium faecis]|uniref:Uncharacterized protein n=1 Tax=Ornithinimicrobium faecis TaxID=2934158 RepID=A0ABY4YYC7_9MICO|nr:MULTISPECIES: hypothetical protein [unclassified Ornithinimicrobium]USQ81764.1 hypothetical protein NF556_08995 [Ornithinimicrobium sp. HY1793]
MAIALMVLLLPMAGLVLAIMWWRRQETRRTGPDADHSASATLRDPAQERRRRDARHKGLMG